MENTATSILEARALIRSYGAGAFVVNNQRFESDILLLPTETQIWQDASIEAAAIEELLKQCVDIEILLIGCGTQQAFISPAKIREWRNTFHIAVEVMDTGAACRTFNVLQAEDRLVAAALVAI